MEMTCINTIRTLAIDAVEAANSGHPGAPMGLAPLAFCLWQEFLRYDPPIRIGLIVTASYSRTATRPCSCTRCCTSPE